MKTQMMQVLRYAMNGIVATAAHYCLLFLCLEFFMLPSAGLANLIASFFGITFSFFGNRYFVFRSHQEAILTQATRFAGLYAFIAVLHGGVLLVWTDYLQLSYQIGFIFAVLIQMLLGYMGGRRYVFVSANQT